MTVKELIVALSSVPQEYPVEFFGWNNCGGDSYEVAGVRVVDDETFQSVTLER